jgi:diguanylate cyclase (GGDEF)-like protein
MSEPGRNQPFRDDLLELLMDTLHELDPDTQSVFLAAFLKKLTGVELSEEDSLTHWQRILAHRDEMRERLGRAVSVRTAAVEYFASTDMLRNPVLLDYGELKRLRHDASTDPLTGLYNRRFFNECLARELARSRRYFLPLTLVLFDLRNFKRVNDSYGHDVGDEVLVKLARVCAETVRGSDYACRIGGDEFAVLLPQSDPQSAQTFCARIVQRFQDEVPHLAPDVGLGLDYGAASYPEDGETVAALFQAADRRLYAEKRPNHRAGGATEEDLRQDAGAQVAPAEARPGTVSAPKRRPRLHERVSLSGTGAYLVLGDDFGPLQVRIMDLSSGGVAFVYDGEPDLPPTFMARFHLPVLANLPKIPAHQVRVQRVYTRQLAQGVLRVGCSFVEQDRGELAHA